MNIVVCVKQVPDTAVERKLKPSDATLDRASVDGLINELDEYAIEEGLQIAEAQRAAGNEAEVSDPDDGDPRQLASSRWVLPVDSQSSGTLDADAAVTSTLPSHETAVTLAMAG